MTATDSAAPAPTPGGADVVGRIVLLNGSSSAGKTTLAAALQDVMPDPWHHIALDHYRDGMPGRYRGINSPEGTSGAAGLNVVPIRKHGELVTSICFGAMGQRMLRGMHRAIAAFAAVGNNVVVDDILFDAALLDDYLLALQGFAVYFVGVRCPIEIVQARENSRMGRFPGTALSHFDEVHLHGHYDVEVDTGAESPRDCALRIRARLDDPAPPVSFAELRRIRSIGG